MQEILARNLDARGLGAPPLLTTQREALSLYRAILRHSLLYTWDNEAGQPWRDVIRQSARAEFEAVRPQRDPETIARLLVTGRDCLQQAAEKFDAKRKSLLMAATIGQRPP
ncbi:hypothetical protein WJX81_006082 [Elliptochloris bilobata]|uniref:Complex 1 LYR protein domain-containing protein n=1 Tax=Elliptochloris bilobata TaxID=381761 RepID=A0AAW1RXQ4_9CHLO